MFIIYQYETTKYLSKSCPKNNKVIDSLNEKRFLLWLFLCWQRQVRWITDKKGSNRNWKLFIKVISSQCDLSRFLFLFPSLMWVIFAIVNGEMHEMNNGKRFSSWLGSCRNHWPFTTVRLPEQPVIELVDCDNLCNIKSKSQIYKPQTHDTC